MNKLTNRSNY